MQNNLIVMVTAVVLALATFISTSDARHIQSRFNQRDQGAVASNSESTCGPCPDDSNFSYVYILRGRHDYKSYLYIDLLSPNGCCDVVAKEYANPLDIRVNHCRSTIEDNGVDSTIEIQSYVQINSLVGVNSIEEGANLTLQVRGQVDKSHYQMHLEPYNTGYSPFTKFALAFVPPNATEIDDKYYVIPEGEGDTATLTLHRYPQVDKYVFEFPVSGGIAA